MPLHLLVRFRARYRRLCVTFMKVVGTYVTNLLLTIHCVGQRRQETLPLMQVNSLPHETVVKAYEQLYATSCKTTTSGLLQTLLAAPSS